MMIIALPILSASSTIGNAVALPAPASKYLVMLTAALVFVVWKESLIGAFSSSN